MTDTDFERLYRQAACGLLSTTPAGVVLDVNDTLLEWTGHRIDDIVGAPFTRLLDAASQIFFETRHAQALHLRGSVREVALSLKRSDGSLLPVLVNSTIHVGPDGPVVRTAMFSATDRLAYETDLLQARKSAETSEARVRLLQDISSTFEVSAADQDVAQAVAVAARQAFAATETAVLLRDEAGTLRVAGGVNPLADTVPPIAALRNTPVLLTVHADDAAAQYASLAAGLRSARLESVSIAPLMNDAESLGILVCFFGRRREFDAQSRELQQALGRQAAQTLVRIRLQRRLEHLALCDQPTGLANRQHLQQALEAAIDDARQTTEPLTLIFLDLDGFKLINDQWGHAMGDSVLRVIADRLEVGTRVQDIVGRMGGDEFVIICPRTDRYAAEALAGRILAVSRQPIDVAEVSLTVSISGGVAIYRPDVDVRPTADQLLIRADAAMYFSKGEGKNRVTIEEPGSEGTD